MDECKCVHFRASHPEDGPCSRTLHAFDKTPAWSCPCPGFRPRSAPLVAGAIGRSVVDAAERYRAQLAELLPDVDEVLVARRPLNPPAAVDAAAAPYREITGNWTPSM